MRLVKGYICVLIAILVAVSCTYYHLSRRLRADIKPWFEIHSPLMHSKVPTWIDANDRAEYQHFLKMPTHIQEAYIYEFFWQIRREGAADEFYSRLSYVQMHFREKSNPWQSHRGYIYLLLGPPTMERYYRNGMEEVSSGMPEAGDKMAWYYFDFGMGETIYWFYFVPPDDWRLSIDPGIRSLGTRETFERHARREFEPTKEGWITYAEYLHDALGDKR